MNLFLVRHGETELNKKGVYYGYTDCPLNKKGEKQSESLKDLLSGAYINSIISSPLQRAKRTAEIIKGSKNIPVTFLEGLKEINFGRWEGQHYTEIEQNDPENYKKWSGDWFNFKIPEGQSFFEYFNQVKKQWDQIQKDYENQNILIVSHNGALKIIFSVLLGYDADLFWKVQFYHGAYSLIEIHKKNPWIKSVNSREKFNLFLDNACL